jgi:hypothetical protein
VTKSVITCFTTVTAQKQKRGPSVQSSSSAGCSGGDDDGRRGYGYSRFGGGTVAVVVV